MRRYFTLSSFIAALLLFTISHYSAGTVGADSLSPGVLAGDVGAKRLYIALETAGKIAVFDTAAGQVVDEFTVPGAPTGVAVSPDGGRLYVTTDGPAGELLAFDPRTGTVIERVHPGHTPCGPVLSTDGKRIYVCCRFDDRAVFVDAATLEVERAVEVSREPIAAAVTPAGRYLLVVNHLPAGAANEAYIAGGISVIDCKAGKVKTQISFLNGSISLKDICLSPDGRFAYVSHILARYQVPTTQLERGWMNTNAVSIIDVAKLELLNTVLLDDVDLGAANPWGVACTADGRRLCVAHAGTHEISVIDRTALHEKLEQAAEETTDKYETTAEDVPNRLSFLTGIRERVALAGNGPRGLVVINNMLYAGEYFSDSLALVKVGNGQTPVATSIKLGAETAMSQVRLGERHFHDARMCFQQWQSCASCHPDGRVDGLNWDLLNDGIGNPKNTKSLLFSHETPPAMAFGVRDAAETAVRAGFRFIQFVERPEADARAVDAYLKALKPLPGPYLDDEGMKEAAARGERIFARAGCGACHSGELFTNLKSYDVGTGTGREHGQAFDTPTLVELWRTGPYLHDGRAATLAEVLTVLNKDDRHGKTSDLGAGEIEDLAAYLLMQ